MGRFLYKGEEDTLLGAAGNQLKEAEEDYNRSQSTKDLVDDVLKSDKNPEA
jgi:hypothetical protein